MSVPITNVYIKFWINQTPMYIKKNATGVFSSHKKLNILTYSSNLKQIKWRQFYIDMDTFSSDAIFNNVSENLIWTLLMAEYEAFSINIWQ